LIDVERAPLRHARVRARRPPEQRGLVAAAAAEFDAVIGHLELEGRDELRQAVDAVRRADQP
jgi:hypothetical protein